MAISSSHLKNLIDDGEIVISPFNASCLRGNEYLLHTTEGFHYYDGGYDYNTVSVPGSKMNDESRNITQRYGYILEPGRVAYVYMQENIRADHYDIQIVPNELFSKYGLTVISYKITNGTLIVEVITNRPMVIKPGDSIAKIQFNTTDHSTASVPIGGIIGWAGSEVPYGYVLCNGSNGTPDLTNKFIVGSNVTHYDDNLRVKTEIPPAGMRTYQLAFIMRIK